MRVKICSIIESDPNMRVIGCPQWLQAVEKVKTLQPDVVTMDILMPRMSGGEAVEMIMKERPTPILLISALTREGINDTIKALEMGAIDYIQKDQLQQHILIEKFILYQKGSISSGKQKKDKQQVQNYILPELTVNEFFHCMYRGLNGRSQSAGRSYPLYTAVHFSSNSNCPAYAAAFYQIPCRTA